MFDIAIVGFGATGISLLKQIQDQVFATGIKNNKVVLLSPSEDFARGKAFGDSDEIYKVNTPPRMLSISDSEPQGFLNWMKNLGKPNEDFPSRVTYSKFLQETYQSILDSGLLKIDEIHEAVTSITPLNVGYKLQTHNKTITAHKVVLCLGSLHGPIFKKFEGNPNFIEHYKQFSGIKENAVLIAGSGLTAIDAFRSLDCKKNNEIHLFSRHGHAPTCLSSENRYSPKVLLWQNLLKEKSGTVRLQSFLDILKEECQLIPDGGERKNATYINKKEGLTSYFEYLMGKSKNADLPYQDILVSTRPYMHKLWRSMSIADRISFNINYGASWAAWRHPIPYDVVSELASASREGRLHIHQATASPRWENKQFILESDNGKIIKTKYLVDGTGGTNRIDSIDSPLLKNLIQQRLIEAHPCGGVDIHPLTYQCQVHGKPILNLYNLGPLSKGSLFSTNAFWFNAQCAGHWARQWAIEMTQENMKIA
ncbi:MAG: FAD/NAD(P)-binding protein [Proteobacteria bacterium]|nr:FAD/NAD(P)-binding protein [Pseudomonadota bacterium]